MHYITRRVSRGILFLFIAAGCLPPSLFSQTRVTGVVQLSRNTPREVLNGSAKQLTHFDRGQKLRVVLGLQPPHLAEEEQFLQNLQDPKSPDFHHFLAPAEWNKRFAPNSADEQAVVDWVHAQGLTVTNRYPNRLLVDLEGTVNNIEKAFNVNINNYQLGATIFYSNDREPSLPISLTVIVGSVGGLNNLQVLHPAITGRSRAVSYPPYTPGPVVAEGRSSRGDAQPAKLVPNYTDGAIDPNDLKKSTFYNYGALYNQGHCCNPLGNPGSSPKETSIAIATSGDVSESDIQSFASQFGLAENIQRVSVDGASGCCDSETALDVEWSMAMANSFGSTAQTALIRIYEGVDTQNSTFTDIYNQILTDNVTRVMSTSWGCAEVYCIDSATASTTHNIFNQMVGEGWSIVAASGDQGATADCAHTSVGSPASDPDIVAAGGTELISSSNEVAWSGSTAAGSCASNNGGSTGGCSVFFTAPSYQTAAACTTGTRSVPDLALNASPSTPQIFVYNGFWQDVGGTSIVAPELAGFFAQENAYLLYIGSIVGNTCGSSANAPCAPIGNPNFAIYAEGMNKTAPHFPFYDTTLGCNSNDVTLTGDLKYYCAGPGYDQVTGWGSANMLQLAWTINDYIAGDGGPPTVTFSGPTLNGYYNTDQTLSWTIADTSTNSHHPNGVAGFTAAWDAIPADVTSEPTPGSGNSFYAGPANPNGTTGSLDLAAAGQGCHTAKVQAWDNSGQTAGPSTFNVCYDITPPVTVASLQGTQSGSTYISAVTVTLTATDNLSGVASTIYSINNSSPLLYTGPFTVSSSGTYTINFHSVDKAGNVEANESVTFTVAVTVSLSQTSLSFAAQQVYTTSAAQSVILTNTGSSALSINSITTSGDFSATNNCGSSLSPNTSCTINVTFTPTASGARTGSVVISDSAPSGSQSISLSGTGVAAVPLQFVPVTPCRIMDTRTSGGAPELAANSTRNISIGGVVCGIPASALAYSVNATVVPNAALGYLTMWPAGQAQPTVSTLNSLDGRIKANAAIVPAGTNGAVSVYVTDATQFILDIDGYFVPATSSTLAFYPVTPCRIADTRGPNGALGGPYISGGSNRSFPILSACSLPSTAQAYSLNFTAVPKSTLGYITVWPTGGSQPTVSTLNAPTGTVTANAAIVPAGTAGYISVYASDSTDLVIDIDGYFAAPNTGGLSLYTLAPCRVLDTRNSSGQFNGQLSVQVGGECSAPVSAQAYVMNATVVPPGSMGYLTLWPNGGAQPSVSTLNAYDGAISSNMAIVPSANGFIDAFSSNSTQLILDISGFFAP